MSSIPTTNLCGTGAASSVTDTGAQSWVWNCTQTDGTSAACYAVQGSGTCTNPTTPSTGGTGPTGIVTPQDLINYFTSIEGKGIVSGEFVETGDPAASTTGPIATIQSMTGQWIGMVGGDYYHFGASGAAETGPFDTYAISYWQAGGLIALNASMPNPTTGGGSDDTSSLNASDLLAPGTATNTALNASLSQIAAGIQQLQTAGVVVIFRPFHEMNGNWFWWGTGNLSASQFQALWQYTYNYMTTTAGLHNIVWMYAVNAGTGSLTATYPGSTYVDMVGQDLYTDNPGSDGQSTYQTLMTLGKPVALAEFGSGSPSAGDPNFSMPTLISQVQQNMPDTVYWLQWWAGNAGNPGWGMEEDQNLSAALNDGYVINRGKIGGTASTTTSNSSCTTPTPTPAPTPTPTPTPTPGE